MDRMTLIERQQIAPIVIQHLDVVVFRFSFHDERATVWRLDFRGSGCRMYPQRAGKQNRYQRQAAPECSASIPTNASSIKAAPIMRNVARVPKIGISTSTGRKLPAMEPTSKARKYFLLSHRWNECSGFACE